MTVQGEVLARRALRINQAAEHPLYVFALTAGEVLKVADISRISRDDVGDLIGYQRPEVRRHVEEITEYLDSGDVLFPNAIIIALTPRVRFIKSRGTHVTDGYATGGTLEIPIGGTFGRPGWIVDGQQRALALSRTTKRELPVLVTAFVTESVDVQRDQFLRVNSTRPLPRGLVTELLPAVSTPLSRRLSMRKAPAELCDLLNRSEESPFHGLIRRPSGYVVAEIKPVVTDTSIINMLEESLTSHSGCLFPHRDPVSRETDFDAIWAALLLYWNAVRDTFPEAWGRPAGESRLMHGAGIRAMGRLMDRMLVSANPRDPNVAKHIRDELSDVASVCRWTSGEWEDLGWRWDELQNVPSHINSLSSFLIRTHMRLQGAVA